MVLLVTSLCVANKNLREKTKPIKIGTYQNKSYYYGKDIEVTY